MFLTLGRDRLPHDEPLIRVARERDEQLPLELVEDDSDRVASCVFYDEAHDQPAVDEGIMADVAVDTPWSERPPESSRETSDE